MSFDSPKATPQKIAIVGGGISGLAAAYLLAPQHRITLFESEPALGGHARTITAGKNGDQPVDTGFIVFNYANYPNLTAMFEKLQVPVAPSNMSFGTTINQGQIEYGLSDLRALLCQPSNLARPAFIRMIRDIFRFNAQADAAEQNDDTTIGDLMRTLKLGNWFQDYYLMPICGAIWSTPPDKIRDFPARSLLQFFRNHALMSATGQHQWWTVDGGSIEYVSRLRRHLIACGVTMRSGTEVKKLVRGIAGGTVHCKGALPETFDHVIFACHSDDALRLLDKPTSAEEQTLSALKYQDNRMVLHCDDRQMPRRRSAWSSWVYQADHNRPSPSIGVTYWMNRLQNIPQNDPLFVSLNPITDVPDHMIYDEKTFRHPVFDGDAIRAQGRLQEIQGQNNTWFCGAYTGHGFHEDGFASALKVANRMERQLL